MHAEQNDLAVDIRDLAVAYRRTRVLSSLDLTIRAGTSVAVTGRSGSGKSTLLATLLGMVTPSGGHARVLGTDVARLGRTAQATFRSNHIGMVFQDGELLPELTAVENAALPAVLPARQAVQRVAAFNNAARLLDRLEVPQQTQACHLSGGERQRTALARALVNEPAVVLADEPTGSLDAELRDVSADLLFATARDRGCALLLVTHDPAIAARAGEQYELRDGHLLAR